MALLPGVGVGSVPSTEGLPALGRAARGLTDAHHLAEQQPMPSSCPQIAFATLIASLMH